MNIKEQVKADRLQARKDRNEAVTGTLTYILGQIDLREKAPNAKGDVALAVVKSHIKSMAEVIANQPNSDAALQGEKEIQLLSKYLPAQVSEAELETFIKEITATESNRGLIMKAIKEKYSDSVDMKLASQIVGKYIKL